MKRGIIFILSICLFITGFAQAQVQKAKAHWTYTFSKPEVKKGETVDLIFTAIIDKDWYMYSSDFDPDLGPMLTTFTFEKNNTFEVVGKLKPQNPKTKFEEVWQGNVRYFEGKGVFKQTVKILADNPVIKGTSEYQTCSHINGLCIPGGEDFEFKGLKVAAAGSATTEQPAVGAAKPATNATTPPTAPEVAASPPADTAITVTAHDSPGATDSAAATTPKPPPRAVLYWPSHWPHSSPVWSHCLPPVFSRSSR
jgi:thiol:disulfide interchange protein DsbD